uniref:mannan endo-1,4-beta-mannosidase n=1 Tax=Leersia perrieri TaxID=77586 RepID=A0A0D9WF40_9ORYZ
MATYREKTRGKALSSLLHCLLFFLLGALAMAASVAILHLSSSEWRCSRLTDVNDDDPSSSEVVEEWGMVRTRGVQFVVGNGGSRPFYVNGFNTYWLMVLAVDPSTRGKVTEVFRQAAAVGLTVCRTWAFNDGGWRALQKSPGVYDEEVFKALDFVVSEARKHRMRLILPLCNNWDDYGGKAQYVRWAQAAGVIDVNLTTSGSVSADAFFSDETIKGYYKSHVNTILTRVNSYTGVAYRDDPTIMAWELMNEPRCASDPTGDTLQAWIGEMASHVKSVDPAHLLTVGTEGFYGRSSSSPVRLRVNPNADVALVGTDFVRNHRVHGVDFASAHIYPDTWLPAGATREEQVRFAESWVEAHVADGEGAAAVGGKPVLFSEFGVSVSGAKKAAAFNATSRDAFVEAVYGAVLRSTRRGGGGAGALLWQVFPEGTEYMDDGYVVVLPRAAATAGIIAAHSRRLQAFNSRCKTMTRNVDVRLVKYLLMMFPLECTLEFFIF